MLDPVAEPPGHDARVVREFCGRIAIEPAAVLLQRLRQVPMIEAQPPRDAVRHEPIDQALVKVEAALLDRAAAGRKNARPRGRKPISGKIAACEQIDIVAPAVIVVTGDIAGIAVLHAPGRVGEDVPDALPASVFVDRAFDLIARGRRAPYEVGGKRTLVVGGMTRAYNSARGEQAERRRQQSSARHDQHYPAVWVSSSRIVGGLLAGPSVPSGPRTRSLANSGRKRLTGSSRPILPCSIRIMATTEVTAFVIEARRNMSFSPISAALPTSRTPPLRW